MSVNKKEERITIFDGLQLSKTVRSPFYQTRVYLGNKKYKVIIAGEKLETNAKKFTQDLYFKLKEDGELSNKYVLFKCYPANTVKNYKEKSSIFAETEAIKKNFKSLPHNIKILDHECNISTFSLFKFIDCCITVRGTVGIEAACFGIPVITAGTGRYNDLGFTIDSNNINDYGIISIIDFDIAVINNNSKLLEKRNFGLKDDYYKEFKKRIIEILTKVI